MANLLILGGGGHGKVVASIAMDSGGWGRIAILDDKFDGTQDLLGLPVIGRLEDAARFLGEFSDAFVAIGDNQLRRQLHEFVERLGFRMPTLRQASASVSPLATLGEGSLACAQSAVIVGATLGRGCIVNTAASVGHDCRLGDFIHVAPGVRLAGGVVCGDGTWIGMGASVKEEVRLGRNVTVGAGAVVLQDVPDGVTVVGVPARIVGRDASLGAGVAENGKNCS